MKGGKSARGWTRQLTARGYLLLIRVTAQRPQHTGYLASQRKSTESATKPKLRRGSCGGSAGQRQRARFARRWRGFNRTTSWWRWKGNTRAWRSYGTVGWA